jgi:hypothetical protein
MRPKAELTDEVRAEIEQILRDVRSDDRSARMEAPKKIQRLRALYGQEALQSVEEELAAQAWAASVAAPGEEVIFLEVTD